MAVTQNSYTRDGSATNYSFTFPYLDKSDVKVRINGVTQATTEYSFANATTLTMGAAGSSGDKLVIYRDTNNDSKKATFYAGSAIKSEDLNDNYDQILYVAQEVDNNAMTTDGTTSMTADLPLGEDVNIVFEGATDNAYETTLTAADPTADRTITLPNETGTVITSAGTNVIDSAHYVDGSIDHVHLAADLIDGDNIQDDVINSEHIAPGSVDLNHMSANSIDSTQYVDGSIDRVHLAADIVDGTKIADNAIDSEHYVDGSIDTIHIAANAITVSELADSSVDRAAIVNDAVDGTKIADDSINSEHIVDGSIDLAHMSANSVDSDQYVDRSIDAVHIAANTITANEIAADAIGASELADSSIDAGNLQANCVTTAKLADAELTTLAGMQSGTASVLAGGTALAATLTEVNAICDGKSVETTISDTDAAYPTSGAVIDYVAAQIAPLGGLEVIATEVAFPNTQPSSGVVISISDAGGVVFNSSGVSTTGRTVGNSTVTINGAPSSLYSETLVAGTGMMVSSTGSSQTYTYHKILGKEDDIKRLSDDINDFNARYRIASSAPSSDNDDGDLYFDTSIKRMKVYNGSTSAWDDVSTSSSSYIVTLSQSFNGVLTDFTMSTAATDAQSTIVSINGVIQKPNAGTSTPSEGFAISGNTLKLSNPPATGSDYFIVVLGDTVSVGTPSDNTVSTAKLQNLAVTGDKVATNLDIADDKTIRFGTDNDITFTYNNGDADLLVTGAAGKTIKIHGGQDLNLTCETNITGGYDMTWGQTTTSDELYIGYQPAGNGSRIANKHSGGLKIWSDHGKITKESATGFEYIVWNDGTSVDLYYADTKRFETTSTGVEITGGICHINAPEATDAELRLYADEGDDSADKFRIISRADYGDLEVQFYDGSSWDKSISCTHAGGVLLYNNNDLRCEVKSTGLEVNGGAIELKGIEGGEAQLQLIADEGDDNDDKWRTIAHVDNRLEISNLASGSWETNIECNGNGNVELYCDGSKKLETTADGVKISDAILEIADTSCHIDLMETSSTNHRIRNGSGNFYIQKISDDKSTTTDQLVIDGGTGVVQLNHNGGKRFETHADGITVLGSEGNNAKILLYADEGDDNADKWNLYASVGDYFAIENYKSGSWETNIKTTAQGNVELYYSNALRLATIADGVDITGWCRPTTDNYWDIGHPSYRWDDIRATNSSIETSDRNEKEDITSTDLGLSFVNKLTPVSYKRKGKTRTHYGLVAQDVETVITDLGKTTTQFAPLVKDKLEDGTERYGLRYGEFISPLIKAIQELTTKVETLETKVAALEAK